MSTTDVSEIPTVRLDEGDEEDVTVFLDVEQPTTEDLLRLYKAYMEGGGSPYEPYESMLSEADETS